MLIHNIDMVDDDDFEMEEDKRCRRVKFKKDLSDVEKKKNRNLRRSRDRDEVMKSIGLVKTKFGWE